MVDGTPVYAVYPYVQSAYCAQDASDGWACQDAWRLLDRVTCDKRLVNRVSSEMKDGLFEMLRQDPRPAYAKAGSENREYWTTFGRYLICFEVLDTTLNILDIEVLTEDEKNEIKMTGNMPHKRNILDT